MNEFKSSQQMADEAIAALETAVNLTTAALQCVPNGVALNLFKSLINKTLSSINDIYMLPEPPKRNIHNELSKHQQKQSKHTCTVELDMFSVKGKTKMAVLVNNKHYFTTQELQITETDVHDIIPKLINFAEIAYGKVTQIKLDHSLRGVIREVKGLDGINIFYGKPENARKHTIERVWRANNTLLPHERDFEPLHLKRRRPHNTPSSGLGKKPEETDFFIEMKVKKQHLPTAFHIRKMINDYLREYEIGHGTRISCR